MTATTRMFREVLSNQALTQSAATEARQIVARAEHAVEKFKAEIATRESRSTNPTPAQGRPASTQR